MSITDIWQNYGPNVWFKSTIENDKKITKQLGHSISTLKDIKHIDTKQGLLEAIIITDQIVRHVHRNDADIIEKYGLLSVQFSKKFVELFQPSSCFELLHVTLPLRHWSSENHMVLVMNTYDSFVGSYPEHENYVSKLRNTTIKRHKLWLRKNANLKEGEDGQIIESEILDTNCSNNKSLNIDNLLTDPKFIQFDSKFPITDNILLSLSGGVDSMVLALLFLGIRKKHGVNIHAFHFNYGVRKESDAEELYLKTFCCINDVPFHCAHLDTSDPNLPGNWDNASKNQRFNQYKNTIQKIGCITLTDVPVVLGHHMDDVEENLLMNLFNTGSCNGNRQLWYDMSGMSPTHYIKNIRTYRPLVDMKIRKDWVLQLAQKYHVPYFRDTSFELATRIRVRRELIPLMKNIFGDRVDEQILKVDTQSKELETLIQKKISTDTTEDQITLYMADILSSGLSNSMISSAILDSIKNYMYDHGCNIPTLKSLNCLTDTIRNGKKDKFEMMMRVNYKSVFYRNSHKLVFLIYKR